jgi:hypothetical protein
MDRSSYKLLLLVIVLHVALYAILIKSDWLMGLANRESAAQAGLMGQERADYARNRATDYYTRWFVNTGVQQGSFDIFIPTEHQIRNSQGISTLGGGMFGWMSERLYAFWAMVYQVMLRSSATLMWWPLFLLAAVPFCVDAWVVRKVKQEGFGLTSPTLQALAVRGIAFVVLGYFLLLFAPVFIHPAFVPAMILGTCGAMWLGMSQFVKRG